MPIAARNGSDQAVGGPGRYSLVAGGWLDRLRRVMILVVSTLWTPTKEPEMALTPESAEALKQSVRNAPSIGIPRSPNNVPDATIWPARDSALVRVIGETLEAQEGVTAVGEAVTALQEEVASLARATAPTPVVYPNIDAAGAGSYQEGVAVTLHFAGEELYDPNDNAAALRTELRVVPTTKFRSGGGVYIPAVGAAWGDVVATFTASQEENAPPIISVTASGTATPGLPYVLLLRNVANDGSVDPSPWVAAPFSIVTGAG